MRKLVRESLFKGPSREELKDDIKGKDPEDIQEEIQNSGIDWELMEEILKEMYPNLSERKIEDRYKPDYSTAVELRDKYDHIDFIIDHNVPVLFKNMDNENVDMTLLLTPGSAANFGAKAHLDVLLEEGSEEVRGMRVTGERYIDKYLSKGNYKNLKNELKDFSDEKDFIETLEELGFSEVV